MSSLHDFKGTSPVLQACLPVFKVAHILQLVLNWFDDLPLGIKTNNMAGEGFHNKGVLTNFDSAILLKLNQKKQYVIMVQYK